MRPRFRFLAILLPLLLILSACGESGPPVYTSAAGGFSVERPASTDTVELQPSAVSSWAGPVEVSTVTFNRADGTQFGVIWRDLPEDMVTKNKTEVIFDLQREQDLASSSAGLVSERSLSLQGYPGREVILDITQSAAAQSLDSAIFRYYLVGRRLYTVLASGHSDPNAEAEMTTFLDSFQLQAK